MIVFRILGAVLRFVWGILWQILQFLGELLWTFMRTGSWTAILLKVAGLIMLIGTLLVMAGAKDFGGVLFQLSFIPLMLVGLLGMVGGVFGKKKKKKKA